MDGNGIYICALVGGLNCGSYGLKLAALPKGPLLDGSAQTVQANFVLDVDTGHGNPPLQGAANFDPVTTSDPAWFAFELGNSVFYNGLRWANGPNAPPSFQAPFSERAIPGSFADSGSGAMAPQLGSSTGANLAVQGSRLMMAAVRKIGGTQYLWTCHHIQVNSGGNNDNTPADRSAVEWLRIETASGLLQSGRVFDSAPTNPKWYYMPSLAVNSNGDMVLGFSGSGANDYISAYCWGRLSSGASPGAPVRYFAGKDWFYSSRYIVWGDYSYTSLDPDGLTFWTIQEYAETRYSSQLPNAWGTRIAAIKLF